MRTADGPYLRTLFLHPPSYDGFDGGAGSRYQARREVRSFWYPTWLAQPAALVPGSRLVDAPPEGLTIADIRPLARAYDLAVLHTSTPSFAHDVRVADTLKAENPDLRIGFVGAHVAVDAARALRASEAIEFVARNEFDFTIQEVAQNRPLPSIPGLSFRATGAIRHTPDRPVLENMDELPFVVDVYHRDLDVERYAIGYLLHPYLSLYTGRGCRSRCTFCLWPQTVGGHRYRTRSVDHVVEEIARARRYFPQVREYFFDDDTLTDDLPRVEALARRLGRLGVTWSCNAKANVPSSTLRILKDNGLRLLLVGYESGDQSILNGVKKGIRLDVARRFTRDAKALGIKIHGTFMLGLPGETAETIERSIRFAQDLDPDTIQVSIAAPYPGTELFRQAVDSGWLTGEALVDGRGAQVSALSYPHLGSAEIAHAAETFYRRFYFRPRKLFAIGREMAADPRVMRRRLREGREFLQFFAARSATARGGSAPGAAVPVAPEMQLALPVPARSTAILSLPVAVRVATDLAAVVPITRIAMCADERGLLEGFGRQLAGVPWTEISASAGSRSLAQELDGKAPLVVIAADVVPDPLQLRDLLAGCRGSERPTTWVAEGRPVATYYPEAKRLLDGLPTGDRRFPRHALTDPAARAIPAPPGAFDHVSDATGITRAERRIAAALGRPGDGYLARLDRAVSIPLSRLLVRTRITPNAVTGISLAVGLAGAGLLAGGGRWIAVIGAALLWLSAILDGCDGEVARLRRLASPAGARLDATADHVTHLATFSAIALQLHRARHVFAWATPAGAMLVGVVASMLTVSRIVNRQASERRRELDRVVERIASRDYVYLVVALTALGRLEWFLWCAAVGANVFWIGLCGWSFARRAG